MRGTILNFSPHKKGSSDFISTYLFENFKKYIEIEKININEFKITPCGNCVDYCFKHGKCKIKDDMPYICSHFEKDDFLIIVTPVYFYHIPGYAKIMIDRTQPYWVKKYVLKETFFKERPGFLICIGATKGEKLFCGINLTIKYFFDIFNFKFDKNLNFYLKKIEKKEEIIKENLENYFSKLADELNVVYESKRKSYKKKKS